MQMFNFLKKKSNRSSKEQVFWKYFLDNRKLLQEFIDSNLSDHTAFNNLTDEIRNYSSLLFVELTKNNDGKYALVITPDGKPRGIPDAENLFNEKPHLDNWVFEKFRQPKDILKFKYDGLEYPSSDIQIYPEIDTESEKINIQVFIKNMDLDKEKYQTIAWLYLDNILGEYNSISKIGYVDFFNLDEGKTVEGGIAILELRKLIDRELYKVG